MPDEILKYGFACTQTCLGVEPDTLFSYIPEGINCYQSMVYDWDQQIIRLICLYLLLFLKMN